MPGDVARRNAEVARILQGGLAPRAVPNIAGLAISARYRASGDAEVGGDWYDVLDLPDAGVALVVGDVAGHGVTAATTMGHLQHAIRAYAIEDDSPSAILRRVNRLIQWVLPGEVATAIVVLLDRDHGRARIASAGHLPPLLIDRTQASYLEVANGPALGVSPDPDYTEATHSLGDAIMLLFTDGLVERRGESIDVGLSRLAGCTSDHIGPHLLDDLVESMPDAAGRDDLAIVAVQRGST